ncbi:MAG: hypothetical protein JNK31_01630 [Candidatus Competibacter sp.]|nr:hypothetical protein [Candidatus Competibacter sp.]
MEAEAYQDEEAEFFDYSAYGFTLKSALPLPELAPGQGRADITIEIESRQSGGASADSPILCASASPAQAHLMWGGVGELSIERGRRIGVRPVPDAPEDALRLFILGAGLGTLLHQRGLLVLHGSAVAIEDRIVGFIGAKGAGKSTTAAILQQQGHPLVADELLVIRFDARGRPLVMPGPSQLRLWSDALTRTGGDPAHAVRVRAGIEKFNVGVARVASDSLPLHSVYLLDAEGQLAVDPLYSSERLLSLIPHLYVSRFGTPFFKATNAAYPFQQLNLLLKHTAIKRLIRRPDLGQAEAIARLIERDCAA